MSAGKGKGRKRKKKSAHHARPSLAKSRRLSAHETQRQNVIDMIRCTGAKGKGTIGESARARYAVVHGSSRSGKTTFIRSAMQDAGLKHVELESIRSFDPNVVVGRNLDQVMRICAKSVRAGCSSNLFTQWLCRSPEPGRVIELEVDTSFEAWETRNTLIDLIRAFETRDGAAAPAPPPQHAARIVFSCVGDPRKARALCARLSQASWGAPRIPFYRHIRATGQRYAPTLPLPHDKGPEATDPWSAACTTSRASGIAETRAVLDIVSGRSELAERAYQRARSGCDGFGVSKRAMADAWYHLPVYGVQGDVDTLAQLSETVSFADCAMQGMQAWSGCAPEDTLSAALWWPAHSIGLTMRAIGARPKLSCIRARESAIRHKVAPPKGLAESYAKHKGELRSKPKSEQATIPKKPRAPCRAQPWMTK